MILVDTSVWVDHLRAGEAQLVNLLTAAQVAIHPWVIGELACGHLRQRGEVLGLLQALPALPLASDPEVLLFIERHQLMGRGIGYLDTHLLASVLLAHARLWTRDRRLRLVAADLQVAHDLA